MALGQRQNLEVPAPRVYNFRPEVTRYLAPGITYDPLRQPIYDRNVLTNPATGTVQFFQVPVGQAGKTELDTNMRLAGQIPSQHVFELWSPRVVLAPVTISGAVALAAANAAEDVHDLMHGAFLRFRIVSQEKLLVPLFFLPAAAGLGGLAAVSEGAAAAEFIAAASNGIPTQEAATRLDPFPVVIPPLQTFTVEVTFPANVALSANVNFWVVFDGILHRPALP